ncbi:hypothetical protein B0H13DRAFT_2072360, partial [Mycena leptocephala]
MWRRRGPPLLHPPRIACAMRVSVLACMQRHRGTRIQCACEPHSVPYIYELSWASQLHVCFLEPRIRHYQPLRERELRRSV